VAVVLVAKEILQRFTISPLLVVDMELVAVVLMETLVDLEEEELIPDPADLVTLHLFLHLREMMVVLVILMWNQIELLAVAAVVPVVLDHLLLHMILEELVVLEKHHLLPDHQ